MLKKIIKILLIVIWMGVIFTFSSDNGDASSKKSDTIIMQVYKVFSNKKLSIEEQEKLIEKVVFPVRKIAHLTEYLILGLLLISLLKEYVPLTNKTIIIAIILCMLYASSDEIHQLFSSGRSARVLDVIIDTIGSSIGIIIYSTINNKIIRRNTHE